MSALAQAPRKPVYIGQLAVFRNPHRRSTFLVDIAVRGDGGSLEWEPLALNDPRAIEAIAKHRKASVAVVS